MGTLLSDLNDQPIPIMQKLVDKSVSWDSFLRNNGVRPVTVKELIILNMRDSAFDYMSWLFSWVSWLRSHWTLNCIV